MDVVRVMIEECLTDCGEIDLVQYLLWFFTRRGQGLENGGVDCQLGVRYVAELNDNFSHI